MAVSDSKLRRLERKCATCGQIFGFEVGKGKARKYCDKKCWPKPGPYTSPCSVDGCDKPIRSGKSVYCETHYYRIRRNGTLALRVVVGVWDSCQYCHAPTGGLKYCNSACAARHSRGNPLVRQCVVCAASFSPRSGHGPDRHICSEGCAALRARQQNREHYAKSMLTARGRERVRRAEYKRKAIKLQAFVEDVSRDEVMARGKWKCHLCGHSIPKEAVWPSPMFGTVDHVLPLVAGGKHSYANCKPAHLRCNCVKGAKPVGQLGLI